MHLRKSSTGVLVLVVEAVDMNRHPSTRKVIHTEDQPTITIIMTHVMPNTTDNKQKVKTIHTFFRKKYAGSMLWNRSNQFGKFQFFPETNVTHLFIYMNYNISIHILLLFSG